MPFAVGGRRRYHKTEQRENNLTNELSAEVEGAVIITVYEPGPEPEVKNNEVRDL